MKLTVENGDMVVCLMQFRGTHGRFKREAIWRSVIRAPRRQDHRKLGLFQTSMRTASSLAIRSLRPAREVTSSLESGANVPATSTRMSCHGIFFPSVGSSTQGGHSSEATLDSAAAIDTARLRSYIWSQQDGRAAFQRI